MTEDINVTIAKVAAAVGVVTTAQNKEWATANSELVADAAKFLREQLGPR